MDASVEENIKGFNFFGDQTTNTDVTAKCSDAFNFGPTNCQRFGGALATANFPPSEQLDITDLLSGFAGGGSRVGIAAFTQAFVLSPLKVTGTDNQTVFFSDGTAIDFPMSGSITFLIPGVLLLFMSYRRLKGRGENQTLAV